ncbi:hypothetical protein M422DRAFT_187193, partial [Sphaerobolus stellatus SS14]
RLLNALRQFVEGVYVETGDRKMKKIRSIKDFLVLRRRTATSESVIFMGALHEEVPHEIFQDRQPQKMFELTIDLVGIHNDLYSYNFERARGLHGHNLVTMVMKEKGLNIQGAFDHVAEVLNHIADEFTRHWNLLLFA